MKINSMEAWVEEAFGVRPLRMTRTERLGRHCANIYAGRAPWVDPDPDSPVRTVNFAGAICGEIARLAVLAAGITVDGSERAKWLQGQIDRCYFMLRDWVELGCAYGTVILKPNGQDIDLVTPDRFAVTHTDGGEIDGVVFLDRAYDARAGRYYARLEYHRFLDDGVYAVSNRCFVGASAHDRGKPVDIQATPWAALGADVTLPGVTRPLYGVLRMPGANRVEPQSPLGLPVFAGALEELRDLDVAYSRNASEIYDSGRLALLDDRVTELAGAGRRIRLPRFVKKAFGAGAEEYYQEIDPALNTSVRLEGINALLSQIGFKCGFSNGYFVFNQRSGLMTATQVEADDRRTVQLVKDVRDRLEWALDGVIYALDVFAELYGYAPAGAYAVVYDFGDVTYNREEDRARWWGYVQAGKVPFWAYLVKFEGYSEEEARKLDAPHEV